MKNEIRRFAVIGEEEIEFIIMTTERGIRKPYCVQSYELSKCETLNPYKECLEQFRKDLPELEDLNWEAVGVEDFEEYLNGGEI